MKQVPLNISVSEAADQLVAAIETRGFTVFNNIDHQANAKSVDLTMPASRVIIFGNPLAGTKLMQQDIAMSLDLPLRLAVVEMGDQTVLIHQTTDDFISHYDVEGHPVLDKVASLFELLISDISKSSV